MIYHSEDNNQSSLPTIYTKRPTTIHKTFKKTTTNEIFTQPKIIRHINFLNFFTDSIYCRYWGVTVSTVALCVRVVGLSLGFTAFSNNLTHSTK